LENYRQKFYFGKASKAESTTSGSQSENTQSTQLESGQSQSIDENLIVGEVLSLADSLLAGSLQKVVNGTGIILSTNLGRAPLPESLVEKVSQLLTGYSSLEIQLEDGQRGERAAAVERLLCVLTGCEAAIVVNNCAAAVLLVMSALAHGKEVIVSRGELVEIGGSFRLPDVIIAGGAILREVGTTNRTRLSDFENAINENTALLLKCHRSNFEISGYTEDADSLELKKLGALRKIPFVEDLGSGALLDLTALGLKHEPTVQETLNYADLVMFSGDKLLGGSQAGLIVGKRELVERLRKHPIYRAIRLDKLNIALLESLLAEYLRPDVMQRLPAYQLAAITEGELAARAHVLVDRLNRRLENFHCSVTSAASAFGGGTTPGQTIASCGIKIGIAHGDTHMSARQLANRLRANKPAILSLTTSDAITLDLRCVAAAEEEIIEAALAEIDGTL
jgi:L-seryl-tRNA(Ser) seleniumtransferase